jgi:hypothetical protein
MPGRIDRGAPPLHAGSGASAPVPRSLSRAAGGGTGTATTGTIRIALQTRNFGGRTCCAAGGREGDDRGRGVGAGEGIVAAEQVLRSGLQRARGQAGRGGGDGLLGHIVVSGLRGRAGSRLPR